MDRRKLLLSGLLIAVILGAFATTTSATSQHGHHRQPRHRRPKPAPLPTPCPSAPPAPCDFTFGPWPADVPAGSVSFNDGAHLNFSSLTVIATLRGVNGLLVTYVDSGPTFFEAQHGAPSGELNITFTFDSSTPSPPDFNVVDWQNVVYRQVAGTYTSAGLDSITFYDSDGSTYSFGSASPFDPIDPSQTAFQSPPNVGYVIGLFGAANATALTQIGVCVTGG